MTLFISYGRAIFVRRKAFLSLLLLSRGSLVSSRHPRERPDQNATSINSAIYEFTCLFPYPILFLKTNPVNKQISYPRLCKTNQLTRDSESKRRTKFRTPNFELVVASLGKCQIQAETRTKPGTKTKANN